ncbi:hypothetical protein ACFQ4K_14165 [Tistrella bauzanensis]
MLDAPDGRPSDGMSIFRPFMAFAAERALSFDWSYYLWVDVWLSASPFRDRMTMDLRLTLMGAAAARWAITDRGPDVGIVLAARDPYGADPLALPLVAGWKPASMETGREIETLDLDEPLPAPATPFGWFTTEAAISTASPAGRTCRSESRRAPHCHGARCSDQASPIIRPTTSRSAA